MDKIKLTKREHLGEGYIHRFEHIETGEIFLMPFSREMSLKLGEEGGGKFIPTPPVGYKWVGATSGTIMVDTPSTLLGEDDFTIIDDKYLVASKNEFNSVTVTEYTKVEFEEKYIEA